MKLHQAASFLAFSFAGSISRAAAAGGGGTGRIKGGGGGSLDSDLADAQGSTSFQKRLSRRLSPVATGKDSKKSSKKGKGTPVEDVCLVEGRLFTLEGPTDEVITGPTAGACPAQGAALATACLSTPPLDSTAAYSAYEECLVEDAAGDPRGILYPEAGWFFNRDVPARHTFQSEESNDGDGSLLTSVAVTPAGSKVKIEYIDNELMNEPLSNLKQIGFEYFIEKCPTQAECNQCANSATNVGCSITEAQCIKQLYVNIYTRALAENNVFCDCNYTYLLSNLGAPTTPGEWHTFSFDPLAASSTGVLNPGSPSNCGIAVTCPPTWEAAIAAEYVLGVSTAGNTDPNCYTPTQFVINVGDTSCSDAGMVVYFDNFLVEYESFAEGPTTRVFNIAAA